ncbi:hypothetical protein DNU06_16840 [Putridiphycobacter roseus]|uniref:Uncharacterized protein n=1 Tax=Putridiphycobacter roseus TaxID=2219161 RepID=A0A2W1N9F3_9FLAO|nr:hypothetical protein DNU06_16840 [Putridiphycobacter roseus]
MGCKNDVPIEKSVLDEKIEALSDSRLSIHIDNFRNENSYENDSTHSFHYFKDSITKEQLVKLTYHKYPMVRVYSFLALNEARYEYMQEVIFGHLSDTTEIMLNGGCVIYTRTISDFIMEKAFDYLKGNTKDSLRDLIFYNHPELGAFSNILWDCKGYEPYYQKVLQINQDSATRASLMALASYRKEKDLDFLASEINKLAYDFKKFQIIEEYPHDRFIPFMYDYHKKFQKDNMNDPDDLFYAALASYKNKWANGIFMELINSGPKDYYRNRDRLQAIMKATAKHDTILFEDIRKKAYRNLGKDTFNIRYFDFSKFDSWW